MKISFAEKMQTCTVQVFAGLCNQLFMIAVAYAYAKRNGYTLQIHKKDEKYWGSYLHKCKTMRSATQTVSGTYWKEPRFSYIPIPPGRHNLHGYFQSARYFADVSGEIRILFDPPTSLKEAVVAKHGSLLGSNDERKNSVVVHIRRGDYILGNNKNVHGILDERYYQTAIAAARAAIPDYQLLVFSDDLTWCREQPWLQGAVFVDEPSDVDSLWLMSQFKNFIMSNSTFSWWAVWLSDYKRDGGRVWTPNKWFGPMGPPDYSDVYESDWIQLPIR
jgi:hypothetical protein